MAAIYANNMKENAMQEDALAYLRFVNQKKREDLLWYIHKYCTSP